MSPLSPQIGAEKEWTNQGQLSREEGKGNRRGNIRKFYVVSHNLGSSSFRATKPELRGVLAVPPPSPKRRATPARASGANGLNAPAPRTRFPPSVRTTSLSAGVATALNTLSELLQEVGLDPTTLQSVVQRAKMSRAGNPTNLRRPIGAPRTTRAG